MDFVIANQRWPRFGENWADSNKAPSAKKEATVTIVTSARSKMQKMLRDKVPIAVIARQLAVSRQTIYNWKDQMDREEESEKKPRPSKLDPFRAYIASRLERFDLPATVLLREITAKGYTGGITILRERVARIKAAHVQKVVERFETEPGRQAQVDFAHCGTILHQGRRVRLSVIVVVLGYSRTIWGRFLVTERQDALLESLEEAFRTLGGVPRELLFDNLKQVVATPKTSEAGVVVQPSFLAFAEHWGFDTVVCPVYWPRAKGYASHCTSFVGFDATWRKRRRSESLLPCFLTGGSSPGCS